MTTGIEETFGQRMARIRAEKAKGRATGSRSDIQPMRNGKAVPETVNDADAFSAMNSGSVMTETPYAEDVSVTGAATVYHNSPGKVQMWKPGDDGRYTPRLVANNSIQMLFKLGWKVACPDCGTNHEDSPYPAKDPNSCPGRPGVHWMYCPVPTCKKRLFDILGRQAPVSAPDPNAPDGGLMMRLENTDTSTPEERLRHQYLMHMWHRHPREAQMRNLQQLTSDLMPSPERFR